MDEGPGRLESHVEFLRCSGYTSGSISSFVKIGTRAGWGDPDVDSLRKVDNPDGPSDGPSGGSSGCSSGCSGILLSVGVQCSVVINKGAESYIKVREKQKVIGLARCERREGSH